MESSTEDSPLRRGGSPVAPVDRAGFDGTRSGPPVGYYTYVVRGDEWEWSEGLYRLHGYAPRAVPATLDVLLRHKHPDDRARVYGVFEACLHDGEPYACYHRIVDCHQKVRSVLGVGRGVVDVDGTVSRLEGFYIDLTDVAREQTEAEVQVALAGIAEHRAVIEQAKGAISLAYGCDAEDAFQVLRTASQEKQVKLHVVARQLVEALPRRQVATEETRTALHRLLVDPG